MPKFDKFPLAGSAFAYLVPALFMAAVATALGIWFLAVPLWLAAAFVIFFFRDPPRFSHSRPEEVLSPADGRVVAVEEVLADRLPGGKACLISIFMNLFDVHVNRVPVSGRVKAVHHHPGGFVAADRPEAREANERQDVLLSTVTGSCLLVAQVAGLVARRIECRLIPGDLVQKGERYGMIRFGSRLDVYLPLEAKVKVSLGQKVKAGVTVIGEMEK